MIFHLHLYDVVDHLDLPINQNSTALNEIFFKPRENVVAEGKVFEPDGSDRSRFVAKSGAGMSQHFSGATEVGGNNFSKERAFFSGNEGADRNDAPVLVIAREIVEDIFDGTDADFR